MDMQLDSIHKNQQFSFSCSSGHKNYKIKLKKEQYRIYEVTNTNEEKLLNNFPNMYEAIKFLEKEIERGKSRFYQPEALVIYKEDDNYRYYTTFDHKFGVEEDKNTKVFTLYIKGSLGDVVSGVYSSIQEIEGKLKEEDLI